MSLRRWTRSMARLGSLLREAREIRYALVRVADALEAQNAHRWPHTSPPTYPTLSDTLVTFADTAQSQELADIELRLTAACGQPPTEEQILCEWERRRSNSLDGSL